MTRGYPSGIGFAFAMVPPATAGSAAGAIPAYGEPRMAARRFRYRSSATDARETRRPLLQKRHHTFLEIGPAEALQHEPHGFLLGNVEPGGPVLPDLPLHDRHRRG